MVEQTETAPDDCRRTCADLERASKDEESYRLLCGQLGKRVYEIRRDAAEAHEDIERAAFERVSAAMDKASRVGATSARVVEEMESLARERDKAIAERRRAVNRARRYEKVAKRELKHEQQHIALATARDTIVQLEEEARVATRSSNSLGRALRAAEEVAERRRAQLVALAMEVKRVTRIAKGIIPPDPPPSEATYGDDLPDQYTRASE